APAARPLRRGAAAWRLRNYRRSQNSAGCSGKECPRLASMSAPRPSDTNPFHLLQPSTLGGLNGEQIAQLQLATEDPQGKKGAILVVDDNDELRTTIVLKLELFGYNNVTTAANGEVALELIRQREFDLVILDIEM